MKKLLSFSLLFLLFLTLKSFCQETNVISGRVQDTSTGQPLSRATITIKNTKINTQANDDGVFQLKTTQKLPLTLVVTYVGYSKQEFVVNDKSQNLSIALNANDVYSNQVVVTASRVRENILKSPVAIQKLDIRALRESPAPSFYDALENVKGVEMITSSITLKVPNTRGFNNPNNFRFVQLVDGVDMQSATLGVPLGNAIGPTELDIASIEITPGAASALYGMSALNGLANLQTKNPFQYQGLSIYQKGGINHVDATDHDRAGLSESALRYAYAYKNTFAFKVNGSYLAGTDWISDSRIDQNPNSPTSTTNNPKFASILNGTHNLAYDGWNKYGDDALAGSNTVSISGLTIDNTKNNTLSVARTGYWEKDLVSPKVSNLKADVSLYYKIKSDLQLEYSYRYGKMDGVFQRGNKVSLQGAVVQNHKLELKGKDFTVLSYVSLENTGNSFNVKPLADNLDLRSGGSSSVWAAKYKNALQSYGKSHGGLTSGNLADATDYARLKADSGRAEPGTAYFNSLRDTIIKINNWDIAPIAGAPATGGAALIQMSRMFHNEAQWDLSRYVKKFDLLIGADARVYDVIPDGNNFVDFRRPLAQRNTPLPDGSFGHDLYYEKYGGFAQATKTFFEQKLKLFGSIRYDYNPYFDAKITPRIAGVYTLSERHNFRFTVQQGYRYPSLFEALSFVNNGGVRRVGSLAMIDKGLGYLENSYTQTSVSSFNTQVNAAVAKGANRVKAANDSSYLLQVANLPVARPEKINSFELGYKSVLLDNKLLIDVDAYLNVYDGFLGQVQVFVPNGHTVGTAPSYVDMLDSLKSTNQSRYRVYTNAKNTYTSYGASAGASWEFYQKYSVGATLNYNKLESTAANDYFITGFNTPEWAGNISIGNREVIKHFGFNVLYKWQQSYLWQSQLVTSGTVNAINTFDAQITYGLPKYFSTIKVGGTDIFNKWYIQYAGGPTIQALYYVAITVDLGRVIK